MNTTTAVEQSANFSLHTLPGIFDLQNEAFERLQKVTHLNLAAFKAMMEEGKCALSPQQSGLPPIAGAISLSQRFTEHAVSYSTHIREIDSQFMAAVARAAEDARNQCTVMWTKAAAGFGQTPPFGSDAASTALQSALAGVMRAQRTMQETIGRATGTEMPGTPVPDIA
jgi:hypothetical protein